MKRVIKASWTEAYAQFQKIIDENWSKGPGEVEMAVKRFYLKHKGQPDYDEAYRRWLDEDYVDDDDDIIVEPEILYVIEDSHGKQLSAPNKDDSLLWDRVESMEARGARGLSVVVYQGE